VPGTCISAYPSACSIDSFFAFYHTVVRDGVVGKKCCQLEVYPCDLGGVAGTKRRSPEPEFSARLSGTGSLQ
jgi:hypothetical protein